MSATAPQAKKQSPVQKGKHMGLGKTLLPIMKNTQRAAPAPWERSTGYCQECCRGSGDLLAFPESRGALPHAELLSAYFGTSGRAPRSSHLFQEFSWTCRCFFSTPNNKEGASRTRSCNTNTTRTGATSLNSSELPSSTAASKLYLWTSIPMNWLLLPIKPSVSFCTSTASTVLKQQEKNPPCASSDFWSEEQRTRLWEEVLK